MRQPGPKPGQKEEIVTYYAVTDANGPISVALDATTEEEARAAFAALDTRAAIDDASTDAEDDLGFCGDGMSSREFDAALEAIGATCLGPLDATYGGPEGNLVFANWYLWVGPEEPVAVQIYRLSEDGQHYTTIAAPDIEAALEIARENVEPYNYIGALDGGTIWVDVRATSVSDAGDTAVDTVTLHPPEPMCSEAEHDWQSPIEVVGGCEQSPGIQGHGGGIISREVCAHCGRYRITDTWAQRPDTGEQGLESVAYGDADESSEAWVASLREEIEA